jgi:hypothetical protein
LGAWERSNPFKPGVLTSKKVISGKSSLCLCQGCPLEYRRPLSTRVAHSRNTSQPVKHESASYYPGCYWTANPSVGLDRRLERLHENPPTTDLVRRPEVPDFTRGAPIELPNMAWLRAPRAASPRPTELWKMPSTSGRGELARNCQPLWFDRMAAAAANPTKSLP